MKPDESFRLYKKYFSFRNRTVEVRLKDGAVLKGIFTGFFHGDVEMGEEYIWQWHLVDEQDRMTFGMDAFGFLIGTLVHQQDIAEIKFFEDNSTMKFSSL